MKRRLLGLVILVMTAILAACGGSNSSSSETSEAAPASETSAATETSSESAPATSEASGEPVKLTMWWWAESDAPGANDWLDAAVKAYQEKNPNITIEVVEQATDTFIATFQTAASSKSGPDIGAQWATGPVLTQVWGGAITAIADLVPADEVAHWLNTSENTYDGKVWAMPLYLIGVPWVSNTELLTQAGISAPPATWDEVIAACTALRAKGITPFAFGNDLYWSTQLMTQSLDSLNDVVAADTGAAKFTDEKYAAFEGAWKQMADAKCFNDDISSVGASKAWEQFAAGKAAMTIGTDGNVKQWAKDLGADKLSVTKWPVFGTGSLKDVYNATQSTSYFVTSWSEHQQEAADFLTFLHTPEQLDAWYAATGIPPADDRFDTAKVTEPLDKALYALNTTGPQVWLQNFFPPQVDLDGNVPAQQLIFGGQGDAAQAAELRQRAAERWQAQKKDELKNWQGFKPGG